MPKTRALSKLIRLIGQRLWFTLTEQRRVAGHDDDIRVALHAGHEGRLADGAAQVALAAALRDGVFADVDLRAVAVVVVVRAGLLHEELGIVVVVLVDDVRHRIARIAAGPVVGDELHLRILRLDGVVEQRLALW